MWDQVHISQGIKIEYNMKTLYHFSIPVLGFMFICNSTGKHKDLTLQITKLYIFTLKPPQTRTHREKSSSPSQKHASLFLSHNFIFTLTLSKENLWQVNRQNIMIEKHEKLPRTPIMHTIHCTTFSLTSRK